MEYHETSQAISLDVPVHSSSVGQVIDVASPATRKLRALGLMWASLALLFIVFINYLIIEALTSDRAILTSGKVLPLLGSALMPFMAWFSLGSAVQRFRAASTSHRYFRVGPGGVSICVPDDSPTATLRFSFSNLKLDLPWDQIKTWYPFVQTMNGIPTERSIVFETLKNEKLKVKTYHFQEKQKNIAASVDRARNLSLKVEHLPAEHPIRLPASSAEQSFEFKKKRDQIKEIDLSSASLGERISLVQKVAIQVEAKLGSLCPVAEGFKHSRKVFQPFQERRDIAGLRLFVKRGLLRGYELQIEPNDFEYRRLTISICPSSRINDISKYVAGAIGLAFLPISFKWMPAIQSELGEYSQLTPLAMFVIVVAAVGVAAGLLQLPIRLLRMLMVDKREEELKKQEIKLGFQEMSSAEWS